MGLRIFDESIASKTFEQALNFQLLIDEVNQEWASNIYVKLLGNTIFQGSSNGSNWHYNILSTDKYFRLSTDGGATFVTTDLNLLNKYYFNNGIPYTDENQVKSLIPIVNRYQYQTVNIAGVEYWFSDSGLDTLTTKQSSSIADGSITVAKIQNVPSKSLLFRSAAGVGPLSVVSLASFMLEMSLSGINSGDETIDSIKEKLGISVLSGDNTGDQNALEVPITDTAEHFAATNVEDALTELFIYVGQNKNVYEISLPFSSTVAGRIAAATEGTDYPTGWVLSAGTSPVDISIVHGLNRRVANITVCAVTGTEEQALFNTAAYNGWKTPDINSLLIQSLATVPKAIKIYITFK